MNLKYNTLHKIKTELKLEKKITRNRKTQENRKKLKNKNPAEIKSFNYTVRGTALKNIEVPAKKGKKERKSG